MLLLKAVAVVVVVVLVSPAAALGTMTRIGAVAEIDAGSGPVEPSNGGSAVQISESTGTYAVPAGYGVITAWEHRTGSAGGTLHFKVYRPTTAAGRFVTVGSSSRAVSAGAAHTFAVRIPVRPGDRLGLSEPTDTVHLAYRTFSPVDRFAFFPTGSNPQPGATVVQDGPPAPNFRLDVAARAETDADRDGFGDESQDRCPTSATTQGSCPGGYFLPPFVRCSSRTASVIRGTAGANTIAGSARGDRIFAGAGRDRVDGLGGADCIDLGAGNDRARGGTGGDLVLGGAGRDRVGGGSGGDRLSGGGGGDRLAGDSGADRLSGGSGGDRISGGGGRDRISARDRRRDRVSCGSGRDSVIADRIDRVARDCERVRRRG